jgi:hypothetical protein
MKKMKKTIFCIMAIILSLTFVPLQAKDTLKPSSSVEASKTSEVKIIELRLNEINSMDKSKLNTSEKKELRKEVKADQRRLRHDGGVLYISSGALILIIILLVILL